MCLLQKFVHSTIACSVSRTAWLCAMLCASHSLRSPTPPQTDAITCQYAFVCRLHTVCVRSIYRLYAVSMLMGHLLARYCSIGLGCRSVACVARLAQQGVAQWGVACRWGVACEAGLAKQGLRSKAYCICPTLPCFAVCTANAIAYIYSLYSIAYRSYTLLQTRAWA